MKEAQVLVEMWKKGYNQVRPHSSLGVQASSSGGGSATYDKGCSVTLRVVQILGGRSTANRILSILRKKIF